MMMEKRRRARKCMVSMMTSCDDAKQRSLSSVWYIGVHVNASHAVRKTGFRHISYSCSEVVR